MKQLRSLITLAIAFCALTVSAQMNVNAARKLQLAEALVENYYVDPVKADTLVQEAIVAMLKTLDPHSTYTTADETRALTEPLNGNFSGIGVQFQLVEDTVYVIQTIAGGPSEKVGIVPGDRIIAVNDTVLAGVKMPQSKIMKNLRGPKGSVARLQVVRRSEAKPLTFRVIRDDIPLYTVDAAYMATPVTGYIRISSFGAETPKEVAQALRSLRAQGMQNLVIDLSDNGGGYLNAAVDVAGMLLPRGATVVYTEGRAQPTQFYFADKNNGIEPLVTEPLVIMTNEYSASASEILSGAVQDQDRGVVVGRRTFGKGLVQRPFPFPDGSMIRLTTARYYTPSGRSIQKPYTPGDSEDYARDLMTRYEHGEFSSADSIHLDKNNTYTTINLERTVYGGGGIMPDRFVPIDTTGVNKYYRQLRAQNAFNQYVVDYVEHNRSQLKAEYPTEDAFAANFRVTDSMFDDFTLMAEQKLDIKSDEEQIAECRPLVEAVLAGLIGRDLFTPATYYRMTNRLNPVYNEAIRLINSPEEYNAILK